MANLGAEFRARTFTFRGGRLDPSRFSRACSSCCGHPPITSPQYHTSIILQLPHVFFSSYYFRSTVLIALMPCSLVEVWYYSFPNSRTLDICPQSFYPIHYQSWSVQRHAPLGIFLSFLALMYEVFSLLLMTLYLPINIMYDIRLVRPNLSCGQLNEWTWQA